MKHRQSQLSRVIESARDALLRDHPRASYADDVLGGHRAWSGADLRGKARKFAGSYARQRMRAAQYLRDAGGAIGYVGRYGKACAVVCVGMDDFGSAIYQSQLGTGIAADPAHRRIGRTGSLHVGRIVLI